MADVRRPNITSPTTEGKVKQIKDYLYQLTDQLNFFLKSVENANGKSASEKPKNETEANSENATIELYQQVKKLIIKSSDIVDALYETINNKLTEKYLLTSKFNEFKEDLEDDIQYIKESDFIIEQGTTGIWNYRKWKSGKAECYGTITYTDAEFAEAYGAMYCSKCDKITYPFAFIDNPVVLFQAESVTGKILNATMSSNDKDLFSTGSILLYSPENMTTTAHVNIIVKGNYKKEEA